MNSARGDPKADQPGQYANGKETWPDELAHPAVLGSMVGQSAAMLEVFSIIRRLAPSSAPVLIRGQSGTGKELIAREIHNRSSRRNGPFVAINTAALPASLIESELFGYEKGAITGAMERHAGCFEQAHGGTLFLDELGEMPRSVQTNLLRVLKNLALAQTRWPQRSVCVCLWRPASPRKLTCGTTSSTD
jgi:transcriptional regulator with PAS, ATPase and Fis domain